MRISLDEVGSRQALSQIISNKVCYPLKHSGHIFGSRGGSNISTKAALPEGEISSEDCSPALKTRPYLTMLEASKSLPQISPKAGVDAYLLAATLSMSNLYGG